VTSCCPRLTSPEGTRHTSRGDDAFRPLPHEGRLIPADASVKTYSPLVGLVFPDRVRLLIQYDAIVDKLARDRQGVPTDLENDQITLRLQGEL
jgi:hypothetical protein